MQPLEQVMTTSEMWCGRSWEGLVDRRCAAFAQPRALQGATDADATQVVSGFLEFFDAIGISLFRDEEEWIFRPLRPTPEAVIRAVEEHISISSLISALIHEARAGCVDLRVIHALGELLAIHLLMEEEEIRPLVARPHLAVAP